MSWVKSPGPKAAKREPSFSVTKVGPTSNDGTSFVLLAGLGSCRCSQVRPASWVTYRSASKYALEPDVTPSVVIQPVCSVMAENSLIEEKGSVCVCCQVLPPSLVV